MNLVRLLPVFISFFLLGAHFSRAGLTFAALCCLAAPGLLYFTTRLSARLIQSLLIAGTVEWIRTILFLLNLRKMYEMPYIRLVMILGVVALFTLLSACVFYFPDLKKKYLHK